MKVLVACEESQEVCKAFRERGHEAYSCDIQECSGGHPEWHIQGNVLEILEPTTKFDWNDTIEFETSDGEYHIIDGNWDLIIAHPPCTYLTVSGNRWFNEEKYGEKARERKRERESAVEFFLSFVVADCDKIAIENPIGYMNTHFRKPDQTIQPYWFGHAYRKGTCLWLKNLPPLVPTNIVEPGEVDKNGFSIGFATRYAKDESGKILRYNDPETKKARSKTPRGLAQAMAAQWG